MDWKNIAIIIGIIIGIVLVSYLIVVALVAKTILTVKKGIVQRASKFPTNVVQTLKDQLKASVSSEIKECKNCQNLNKLLQEKAEQVKNMIEKHERYEHNEFGVSDTGNNEVGSNQDGNCLLCQHISKSWNRYMKISGKLSEFIHTGKLPSSPSSDTAQKEIKEFARKLIEEIRCLQNSKERCQVIKAPHIQPNKETPSDIEWAEYTFTLMEIASYLRR
jgi:hypothetical protein